MESGNPLSTDELRRFRILLANLKRAASFGRITEAEEVLKDIIRLFEKRYAHPKLLEAKLWYFECLLDNNHASSAESGFIGIRRKANPNTLLHLEATFLGGVSLLRQKKIELAKQSFREVLKRVSRIQSPSSRQRHERRFIERIEEEGILCETIGTYEGELKPDRVHEQAVLLIQQGKSDDEIFELMGSALPTRAVQLLLELRGDAILQLPAADQKLLPRPSEAAKPLNLGKRASAFVKRVSWKVICDQDSPIYQVWSSKLPELYTAGTLTKSLCDAFAHWDIHIPVLVGGVAAIALKYSAQDFCEQTKPASIMELRGKRDSLS